MFSVLHKFVRLQVLHKAKKIQNLTLQWRHKCTNKAPLHTWLEHLVFHGLTVTFHTAKKTVVMCPVCIHCTNFTLPVTWHKSVRRLNKHFSGAFLLTKHCCYSSNIIVTVIPTGLMRVNHRATTDRKGCCHRYCQFLATLSHNSKRFITFEII